MVAQLAIQISAKQRENGADEALEIILDAADKARSTSSRVNLLEFSLRCLTFLVPRPEVVRRVVRSSVNAIVDAAATQRPEHRVSTDYRSKFTPLFRVARENRAVAFDETEQVLGDVYASDDSARQLVALAHLVTAQAPTPRPRNAQLPDTWDHRQRFMEQAQGVWADHYAGHVWVAVWGLAERLVALDDLHTAYGDGALFMWGPMEHLNTALIPPCVQALANTLVIEPHNDEVRDEEVLSAAEPVVDGLRGRVPLSPPLLTGHMSSYLYDRVIGLTTSLGTMEACVDELALTPKQLRRNCWLLAACIERDEHNDHPPFSGIPNVPLLASRPRHALEAVIMARVSSRWEEGPMRELVDAAKKRVLDALADVDPELVVWARGDLKIWADPA